MVFFGLPFLNAVAASQMRRINPELEPVSDKKFFKKDYPDDARPYPINHFSHPYPTVQDSDRYDKDYVKDENDDGGYWKAQMEYDRLKNKLAKEKKEMAQALVKETQEQKEFEKAKAAENDAEKAAEAAEKTEEDAETDRQKADAEHDTLKDHLDEATEEVENEVKDLEDCKKQLAEAKAKLKALLAEKEAKEKKKAEKDASEEGAEDKEKAAEKTAKELLKEYLDKKAAHENSDDLVAKERRDVAEAEAALLRSAEKLRKFRRADPDGGVYEVKSGASHAHMLTALLLVVLGSLA